MQASARGQAARALTMPGFSRGMLRDPSFDALFVLGLAAIALLSGLTVLAVPDAFLFVLVLDIWLFGYHHVISTFTRLAFDRASLREHRVLVFYLPPLVLGAVSLAAGLFGAWVLASTYLYWQWWHYTRQSYGISQIYLRKAEGAKESRLLTMGLIYVIPLWGIAYRSYQNPEEFLGLELRVLPVPGELVFVLGALSVLVLGAWAVEQARALRAGTLAVWRSVYLLSHVVIFLVGYLAITNIDYGWLVINVWHNAQYILIVWLVNQNRFRGGVDPAHRFLSTLSQPRHTRRYFVVSMVIASIFYGLLGIALAAAPETGLPLAIVAYQTINFHHYIVDSFIWKVRKPSLQRQLDIPTADPEAATPRAA